MLEHGFLERAQPLPTVDELLRSKTMEEADVPQLVTISSHQKVGEAIDADAALLDLAARRSCATAQVDSLADVIGSLQDRDLLDRVFKNPDALHEDVATAMQPPLAAVDVGDSLDEVFATLTGRTNAVVVARSGQPVGVLTRSDLLEYLAPTVAAQNPLRASATRGSAAAPRPLRTIRDGVCDAGLGHLLHLGALGEEPVPREQEELRDDLRADLALRVDAHDRALRHDDRDCAGRLRDRRACGVTGAEPGQQRRRRVDRDVARRRDERSLLVHDERTVELRELLDRLAELGADTSSSSSACP